PHDPAPFPSRRSSDLNRFGDKLDLRSKINRAFKHPGSNRDLQANMSDLRRLLNNPGASPNSSPSHKDQLAGSSHSWGRPKSFSQSRPAASGLQIHGQN